MRIEENNFHTVTETEKRKRTYEKKKEQKNSVSRSKSVSYNASKDLARIASARTTSQVMLIIYELRGKRKEIMKSGADASQIKAVCRRIDKVLGKGGTKIKNLKKEAALKEKAELQREAGREKAARKTEEELKQRKKKRKAREHGQIADNGDVNAMLENNRNRTGVYAHCDVYVGTDADVATAVPETTVESTSVDLCL